MTKRPRENLPEPSHPFARWFAGAAISFWALGVQNFADPWNKLGALLSPGVGYLVGFGLENIISRVTEAKSARTTRVLKKKLDDLCQQRQSYRQVGANAEIIAVIDVEINQCQQILLRIISSSAVKQK